MEKGDAADWYSYKTITPTKGSQPFGEITMNDFAPLIELLVDVNVSHYMNSADLENGAHLSGLPTPYLRALMSQTYPGISTGTAWLLPNAESKVGLAYVGEDGFSTQESCSIAKKSKWLHWVQECLPQRKQRRRRPDE